MPNAFQSLGDDAYGPQFAHNVLVIAPSPALAKAAAAAVERRKKDRSLGLVAGVAPKSLFSRSLSRDDSDEISVVDLENLDPEDFDILVLLDADDLSDEFLEDWLRDKFMVLHWQAVKSPEEMEKQVEELIERLDEAEMKAACGAGTSC